jgi:SPP1 family predicted phage head-tail adaptor
MPRFRPASLTGPLHALGAFREQVTVQSPLLPGSDDYVDFAPDLWAAVEPLSGYERLQAAQLQSAVDYRVTIPACPRIDATMRLLWTTSQRERPVRLNIQAVIVGISETVCDCVEAHD